MNLEIERKFLVKILPDNRSEKIHIKQYYLSINEKMVQRLRFFDKKKAIISFKENCLGLSRYEFEYEVQNGVKPAYRYTVEYEDEEESKIPKLGVIYDEQEVIDIGGSLYFEVRIAEVEEENGIPTLGITISSMIIICLSIIYKKK